MTATVPANVCQDPMVLDHVAVWNERQVKVYREQKGLSDFERRQCVARCEAAAKRMRNYAAILRDEPVPFPSAA